VPPVLAPRRNVELKARDDDLAGSVAICRALGAEDHGEIRQRDTYFNVAGGGLKLREESPGHAHLIQFERSNEPQQRESRYRIVAIEDGPALRAVLDAALGVKVVVAKRRRLHVWREVRIHLDEVDGLGTFIELEAVARPESDLTREHALVRELREPQLRQEAARCRRSGSPGPPWWRRLPRPLRVRLVLVRTARRMCRVANSPTG
jgi:adenylate cyclase class 2